MEFRKFNGKDAMSYVDQIGDLRIRVFREYPYLYDGDLEYERKYLESYFDCPQSLVVLAIDKDEVVGATTGIPLQYAEPEWQRPFSAAGLDLGSVFYFGESVLLPGYRGSGIGQKFFDFREAYAASLPTMSITSFCAVRRAANDLRRPEDYRPLDGFWNKRGYHKAPGISATFKWKEIGGDSEISHVMDFWLREFR